MMNTIFDEEIPEKQKGIEYDCDASPIAWEHYRKVYTTEHWHFDIGPTRLDGYRLVADVTNTNLVISGDTDFNFNSKTSKRFRDIIDKCEDDSLKGEMLVMLDQCCRSHHTLKNFSLLERTGNMQFAKGNYHYHDRFDKFVYLLSEYFILRDKSTLGKNYTVERKAYLDTFTCIHDYCNKVYFLNDVAFINRIINEGEHRISKDDYNAVYRYMKLANDYWEIKKQALGEFYVKRVKLDMNNCKIYLS